MADFKPKISHIVCTDRLGVIGYNNKLPWHIPEELEYFKNKTKDSIVLMGHNTYKSLGRPLPNRLNIVISKTEQISAGSVFFYTSLDEALIEALDMGEKESKDIFIIGGSSIYEQTFDVVDNIYLNIININLMHHHQHAQFYEDFNYYPINNTEENFKLISNKTLQTTSTVYSIKVLEFKRLLENTDESF